MNPILIDGGEGEGGGQMLRSALALALLTQQPFRMMNIRARRPKPGLAAQHLASVHAAAAIGSATVRGDQLGGLDLTFQPGPVTAGDHLFRIGTAGATALVLQTICVPLLLRGKGASEVRISGGTHVRAAPTFDYLDRVWLPLLRRLGGDVQAELLGPGFFPRGGGKIRVAVAPSHLKGLNLIPDGAEPPPKQVTAEFLVADLPRSVAERERKIVAERLQEAGFRTTAHLQELRNGPGNAVGLFLDAGADGCIAGFTALGERGKRAEAVAEEAVASLLAHWRAAPHAVDPHAADQLLLPLVFAEGPSRFATSEVTQHLLTNADILRRFVSRPIRIVGGLGAPGVVEIG